jgi:hypothetical protein
MLPQVPAATHERDAMRPVLHFEQCEYELLRRLLLLLLPGLQKALSDVLVLLTVPLF